MIKILIIHNLYSKLGGEDTVFQNEVTYLRNNGHNVLTLIFDNKTLSNKTIWQKFFDTLYNIKSTITLGKCIKEFQPDIIHVHNFFYEASPSIFYTAQKFNIPIIVTIHNFRLICSNSLLLRGNQVCELCSQKKVPFSGIRYKCFKNSYFKTIQLTAITSIHKLLGTWKNKIDGFICLTEFTKHKIVNSSLNINPQKLFIKPNFVEDFGEGVFESRKNFYLFVGRLSKEKGIDFLLQAAIKSQQELIIIGDGPLIEKVKEMSITYDNIKYVGVKNKLEIVMFMKQCKALIFPSIWFEGMPMTILEAFSTGTPIIASNIDNINQIVISNYNGILFNKGDLNDLIFKLNTFLTQENRFLYQNARLTYEEKYHPHKNYASLLSIYNQILKNKKLFFNS